MKPVRRLNVALALTASAMLAAPAADARITKVVVDTALSQKPTFGGFSWPGVGQYEKIIGTAYGEVNPADPRNSVIVDVELAPRNLSGNVEYSFDFYILKPISLGNGAHKVMYEPPNRGNKTWNTFGRVPGGNDPGSIVDPTILASSFLMPRGYTMVWSGWDAAAGSNATRTAASPTTIKLPIAHTAPTPSNPNGTITGPSYEYFTGSGGNSLPLTYPPADPGDKTTPKLTHRVHLDDAAGVIANSSWSYNATGTAITLNTGTFTANDIYEFTYTAKDPTVNGIGFAAIRDFVAWLRYESADDDGTANPLAGDIQRVYTEVVSQPGRLLNDFRHLGFTEAENGNKVFDGHMQWIAAGDGINMNYRFSQPGRTERNRQDHLYAEGVFPFANVMTHDPIRRMTDSRYSRCERSNTCPLGVEIYSANEYWVKAASLLHTDPSGSRDLPDSPFTRNYFMSSMQHGTGSATNRGACQQFQNPLSSSATQRALFIALDEWATNNRKPPESRVPMLKDGTLVPPLPQSGMGFPNIPSPFADTPGPFVTYSGLKSFRTKVFDRFPRTSIPEYFESPAEFDDFVRILVQTRCIDNGKKIWWDVRPHPFFETIEFRVCDIPMRLDESVTLAALIQAICVKLYKLRLQNIGWRRYRRALILENKWRASRYGIHGKLIDFGKEEEVPFAELVREMLLFVDDVVDELGSRSEVERVSWILENGTGADRQLRVYEKTGDLMKVVDYICEETSHGLPESARPSLAASSQD